MADEEITPHGGRVSNEMLMAAYLAEAKASATRHTMVLELVDDLRKRIVLLEVNALGPLFKVLVFIVAIHWFAPGGLPQIVAWLSGAGR